MIFRNLFLGIFIALILVSITLGGGSSDQNKDLLQCDYNSYKINISKLRQNVTNLTQQLNYYKNLSEYYKTLYETKNVILTNKEIIEINKNLTIIHQNISNISQKIENIENNLTIFSIEFSASIVGGVTLIEVILYFSRKKQKAQSR